MPMDGMWHGYISIILPLPFGILRTHIRGANIGRTWMGCYAVQHEAWRGGKFDVDETSRVTPCLFTFYYFVFIHKAATFICCRY